MINKIMKYIAFGSINLYYLFEEVVMEDIFVDLGIENSAEYIRKTKYLNQSQFAQLMNMSYRTYSDRVNGHNDKWLISEIVRLWELNGHKKVVINSGDENYELIIKKL